MRHAFADHIARQTDVRTAQFLLGHANLGTTESYLGKPTLDQLETAVAPVDCPIAVERQGTYPHAGRVANPIEAPTGIEPVYTALQAAA